MPNLSGTLLAMVLATGAVVVVGIAGSVLAFGQLGALGIRYAIAVIFIIAWSLVFLVMTLMRSSATPIVACAGLALWIAYRLAIAVLSGDWPLVIDLLAEVALASGFCGYMLFAAEPKAYYRGRRLNP